MKYLKWHPINENVNWLLSKKDDIIECSHDITDMPYDFLHCGNVPGDSDISYYLIYDGKSYVINWVGGVDFDLVNEGEVLTTGVSGDFVEELKVKEWSSNGKVNDLVEEMLPNIESTIMKLSGMVFGDGDYKISFNIQFYETDLWDDEEFSSELKVGFGIRVIFRLV
jgi:hypothetical protein